MDFSGRWGGNGSLREGRSPTDHSRVASVPVGPPGKVTEALAGGVHAGGEGEVEVVRAGITNALARPLVADIGTEVPDGQGYIAHGKQGQGDIFLYFVSTVNGC